MVHPLQIISVTNRRRRKVARRCLKVCVIVHWTAETVLAFRTSGSFEGLPSVPPGANLDDHLAAVAELRAFTKLSTLLLSITVAPVSTNVGIGEKES